MVISATSVPQKRNTTLGGYERDFDITPFSYALGTSRTLRPYDSTGALEYYRNNWAPFNILNEYRNNYMDIGVLDLKGQAELAYTPVKALELRGLSTSSVYGDLALYHRGIERGAGVACSRDTAGS